MNIPYLSDTTIDVTLSRRNLQELLDMLDKGGNAILVKRIGEQLLFVQVQEDAEHYAAQRSQPAQPAA